MKLGNILYITRHELCDKQLEQLEMWNVIIHKEQVNSADHVIAIARAHKASFIIGVLPIAMVSEIMQKRHVDLKVLRPVMKRIETGKLTSTGDKEYSFEFYSYEEVLKVDIVTKPFSFYADEN